MIVANARSWQQLAPRCYQHIGDIARGSRSAIVTPASAPSISGKNWRRWRDQGGAGVALARQLACLACRLRHGSSASLASAIAWRRRVAAVASARKTARVSAARVRRGGVQAYRRLSYRRHVEKYRQRGENGSGGNWRQDYGVTRDKSVARAAAASLFRQNRRMRIARCGGAARPGIARRCAIGAAAKGWLLTLAAARRIACGAA